MGVLCTTIELVENSRVYQKEFSRFEIILYSP
jgi:hypothetical protein